MSTSLDIDSIKAKKAQLGKMTKSEIRYLVTLCIMMVLFLTTLLYRPERPRGRYDYDAVGNHARLGSVNIREAMKNVPWEVVFFAAVAACITSVVSSSGLGSWIANIFLNWTVGLPLFLTLLVICIVLRRAQRSDYDQPCLTPPLAGFFRQHRVTLPPLLAMPICYMVGLLSLPRCCRTLS